jgi:hypothetical protein
MLDQHRTGEVIAKFSPSNLGSILVLCPEYLNIYFIIYQSLRLQN